MSGLTGEGIDRLLAAVAEAHAMWNKRVATARLNRWLADAVERHPPPAVAGRRIRLRYLTQLKARPPTFVAFCSRPEKLPDAYRRYLVNGLRADFELRRHAAPPHPQAGRESVCEPETSAQDLSALSVGVFLI